MGVAMVPAVPITEFAPLVEALRDEARQGPLVYLPNPGNWGAAFTAQATRRFLTSNGIPFRELRGFGPVAWATGWVRRETLLLGGGGAWSESYPGGLQLANRASRFFRRVFVLPSTFGTPVTLPKGLLWARDRFGSLRNAPAARFCPDLGLTMDLSGYGPPTRGIGEFRRGDGLATGSRGGSEPDLSARGTERSPVEPFLSEIGQYEEVHTDRVHVAIVACLMGRRCHVWPTATPLLADLFASSLAPFFPNAVFRGTLPGRAGQNS